MFRRLCDSASPSKTAATPHTTFTARNTHSVTAESPPIATASKLSNITGQGGIDPLLAL